MVYARSRRDKLLLHYGSHGLAPTIGYLEDKGKIIRSTTIVEGSIQVVTCDGKCAGYCLIGKPNSKVIPEIRGYKFLLTIYIFPWT
jgi:hypothetical protein